MKSFDGQPEHGEAYGRQSRCVLMAFINGDRRHASFPPESTLPKINAALKEEGGASIGL